MPKAHCLYLYVNLKIYKMARTGRPKTQTEEQRRAKKNEYMKKYNAMYREKYPEKKLASNMKSDASEGAGVYCYKDKEGHIVYIGESMTLRRRRQQHKMKNRNTFMKMFDLNPKDYTFHIIQLEEDTAKRKALEFSMISAINPRYNTYLN